jgi:hypothetical protein
MKHKSQLLGVLIVLSVVLGLSFPSFAEYTLSLVAKDGNGEVKTEFQRGNVFYLDIILSNAEGVAGCAFTLHFPADVLAPPATNTDGLPLTRTYITSAFPFTYNTTRTHRENSDEAGKIYFSGAEIDTSDGGAKYGPGQITLFTVRFTVRASAPPVVTFPLTLKQTSLFNPAAGYGKDNNSNGVYDPGVDALGKVPVLVGAVPNSDPKFGGNLADDFPILMGNQTLALATLQLVLNGDYDSDGLQDGVETKSGIYKSPTDTGTNPSVKDTDGDGLTDGDEVNKYKTNPVKSDTDGDRMNDGDEIARGRDPLKRDPAIAPVIELLLLSE